MSSVNSTSYQLLTRTFITFLHSFKMVAKAFLAATLLSAATAWQGHLQVRDAVDDALASASAALASATAVAAQCAIPSSVLAIITTAPTPSPDVANALVAQSDYCHLTCAGSASADCSSYTSALSKWSQSNSKVLADFYSSYTKSCPLATGVNPVCTTGSSGASPTGSTSGSSGSSSGNSTSSVSKTGAAAPHGSFTFTAVAAVVAAVGVLAVAL